MKHLVTVIALVFTSLIASQGLQAQTLNEDQSRPEAIAKQRIEALDAQLNLTDAQERTLFRHFVSKEMSYKKSVNGKDLSNPSVKANKAEIDARLEENMKKTLTADQYKQWLTIKDNE